MSPPVSSGTDSSPFGGVGAPDRSALDAGNPRPPL
jgi:hypothetical protein